LAFVAAEVPAAARWPRHPAEQYITGQWTSCTHHRKTHQWNRTNRPLYRRHLSETRTCSKSPPTHKTDQFLFR